MALIDYYQDLFSVLRKEFINNNEQRKIYESVEKGTFYGYVQQSQLSTAEIKMYGLDRNASEAKKLWAPTSYTFTNEQDEEEEIILQVNDIVIDENSVNYDVKGVKPVRRGVENDHLEIIIVPQTLSV